MNIAEVWNRIRSVSVPAAIGALGALLLGTAGIGLLAGSWEILNDTSKVTLLLVFSAAIVAAWRGTAQKLPTMAEVLRTLTCLALPLDAVAVCARFGGGWREMILTGGCAGILVTELFDRSQPTTVLRAGQICALMVGAAGVAATTSVPFAVVLAGCGLIGVAIRRRETAMVLSGLASFAPFVAPLYPFALGRGVLIELGLNWEQVGTAGPIVGLLTFATLMWSAKQSGSHTALLAAGGSLLLNVALGFSEQTPGRLLLAILPASALLACEVMCEVAARSASRSAPGDRLVVDKWRFFSELLLGTFGVVVLTPIAGWAVRPTLAGISGNGGGPALRLYLNDPTVRGAAVIALGMICALFSFRTTTLDRNRKPALWATATLSIFTYLSLGTLNADWTAAAAGMSIAVGCLIGLARFGDKTAPSKEDSPIGRSLVASAAVATMQLGGAIVSPWLLSGLAGLAAIGLWIELLPFIISHTSPSRRPTSRKPLGAVTTGMTFLFGLRVAKAMGTYIFGSSHLPFIHSLAPRWISDGGDLNQPIRLACTIFTMALIGALTTVILRERRLPGADGSLFVMFGTVLISYIWLDSLFTPVALVASLAAAMHCVRHNAKWRPSGGAISTPERSNLVIGAHLPLLAVAVTAALHGKSLAIGAAIALSGAVTLCWNAFVRTDSGRELVRKSEIGLSAISWLSVLLILQNATDRSGREAGLLFFGSLLLGAQSILFRSRFLRYGSGFLGYLALERFTNPWSVLWHAAKGITDVTVNSLARFGITGWDVAVTALCIALAAIGALFRRSDRKAGRPLASSWIAYAYEIFLFALYCLVQSSERPGLLTVAMLFGALMFAVGVARKLAAPFTLGALTSVLTTTLVIRPHWNGLPEIVWFAAAGIALLALATVLEWRRRKEAVGEGGWTLGRAIRYDGAFK